LKGAAVANVASNILNNSALYSSANKNDELYGGSMMLYQSTDVYTTHFASKMSSNAEIGNNLS
jgi:hypothetical protein